MKKTLSLILAVMMLLGCMSVTAFAEEPDNTTDITLTVAKSLTYDMVIPEDVTNLNAAGIYSVGQAKVANVKNATDKTVISYTAETTAFKCEGKTDIPASYYTDEAGQNTFPTSSVEVYKNSADVQNIPTMYVGISESDFNAAENGTYTATVTFNFTAEAMAACDLSLEDYPAMLKVFKVDDEKVYFYWFNYKDNSLVRTDYGYHSTTKTLFESYFVSEYAVGDYFHEHKGYDGYVKCSSPESHGIQSDSGEALFTFVDDTESPYYYCVPAGSTFTVFTNDDDGIQLSFNNIDLIIELYDPSYSITLNGDVLAVGDQKTINDGDALGVSPNE